MCGMCITSLRAIGWIAVYNNHDQDFLAVEHTNPCDVI